ncbi:MAG: hypothetical protein OXC93_09705 [Rhodospirillaceae bacterium]|nr:hypothetical protein [Rhodospirillaceae bacterium]
MSVLRKLDRKSRWLREGEEAENEASPPADALRCLKSEQNTLSVFFVSDDEDVERAAAAMAASREGLDPFDYALLTEEALAFLQEQLEDTAGDTKDDTVNEWHRDLAKLRVNHVSELANTIYAQGDIKRFTPGEVKRIVRAAVEHGFISDDDVHPNVRAKIWRAEN